MRRKQNLASALSIQNENLYFEMTFSLPSLLSLLKQRQQPTATKTLQNNRFSEQKQWLCTCVLHFGTFLCRHLLNDDVK